VIPDTIVTSATTDAAAAAVPREIDEVPKYVAPGEVMTKTAEDSISVSDCKMETSSDDVNPSESKGVTVPGERISVTTPDVDTMGDSGRMRFPLESITVMGLYGEEVDQVGTTSIRIISGHLIEPGRSIDIL
jgi:hypothetical protein